MKFHEAVAYLAQGHRIRRCVWREDIFIYAVAGSEFKVNREPLLGIYPEGTTIKYRPHLDIAYGDGECAVWFPYASDLEAGDWEVVETTPENVP